MLHTPAKIDPAEMIGRSGEYFEDVDLIRDPINANNGFRLKCALKVKCLAAIQVGQTHWK
jgi:hypothetical protein